MKKWNFDNSYAKLPSQFYTKMNPVPVRTPKLVVFNHALAEFLDVPCEPETLAGNHIPKGAEPLAQAYMGHQFGHLNMLGDGRAILLGEQINHYDERFDIQLKGSGITPYSRGGDGRAALGPMLREYIVSEAMAALGIPTTRSLAVVETGEAVLREKKLRGAILTRVAASHIRVGTFEYAARRGVDSVRILADYAMRRHFPEIETYVQFLGEVVARQAALVAKWQLVGFIHGVMNTDNMAISGETIDYGPCAFMNAYDPDTVFSSIDTGGRYAYKNQPKIAVWNLARFAETLLPLLHEDEKTAVEIATAEVEKFGRLYHKNWLAGMRAKLGLADVQTGDEPLITDLLELMLLHRADYTNTFRDLTLGVIRPEFRQWEKRWQERVGQIQVASHTSHLNLSACPVALASSSKFETRRGSDFERPATIREFMQQNNPAVIPRNHRVEEALAAAENGDLSVMEKLLHVLEKPYSYSPEQDEYAEPPPDDCRYRTFCGT